MNDNERVIEKIKKCLALSKSSNANEAAIALRQAQRLMEAHNIDAAKLAVSNVNEAKVQSNASVSKVKVWEMALINLVAEAFGCKILWAQGYGYESGHFCFIGEKTQLEGAQYTATVLLRKLLNARKDYVNEELKAQFWLDRKEKTSLADGFCLGWVAEIKKTVHAYAGFEEIEPILKQYIDSKYPVLHKGKPIKNNADYSSFEDGRRAASGESLHRPLNEDKRNRITHQS